MNWRCLKEGILFNDQYEIERRTMDYSVWQKNPLKLIGRVDSAEVGAAGKAKALAERHAAGIAP